MESWAVLRSLTQRVWGMAPLVPSTSVPSSAVRKQEGSASLPAGDWEFGVDRGELTCPLCRRILAGEPLQCNEGHIFCKECIEKALCEQEECPIDRCKLRKADLRRNALAERLVSNKRMRCPHAAQHTEDDGCGWVGRLSEQQKHLDNECGYAEVPCSHDGCEVRVQRRLLGDHETRCERLVEACQYCDGGVVVAESLHHLDVCPMAPVHCFECEESYLRKDTAQHQEECPDMPVGCEFHASGCTPGTLLRRDVDAHQEDLAGLHAVWALKRVKSLRAKVKVVQREHAAEVAAALELARRLERRVDVLSQKVAAAQEPAVLRTQPQEGDPFVTSGECVAKPSGGKAARNKNTELHA